MIFVAVGTQKFPLNRLLVKLDELVEKGVITEEIFAQTGSCTYVPKNFASAPFMTKEEFEQRIAECDFVITHSGVNTIVSALKAHKKVIVFPRLLKYNEHVDDHQCQIALAFSKKEYVLFCKDENDLENQLERIRDFQPREYQSQRKNVIQIIEGYLQEQEKSGKNKTGKLRTRTVLMCGSDPERVGGGMISVIKQYLSRDGEDGYRILYVPTHIECGKVKQSLYYLNAFRKVAQILLTKKADLVHLHIAERGSFFRKAFLVRLCRLCRAKVILHNHAAEMEDFYGKLPGFLQSYMRRTYEMADVVIVLSPQMVERIRAIAPKAPVKVLYNAVNVTEENPYDPRRTDLLLLGRLGERKGVYDLIEVLKEIDDRLPEDTRCYLCGDGEVDKVNALVKEYGLSHRVAHVGWVDGNQKESILQHTGVNILPSYNEGLPMTILETMARGIPNISTAIASIPEVIETGSNGILIQPGDRQALKDAILALVSDEKKRETFSKASHELINSKFSLDAHMKELHRIYGVLLSWRK